MLMRSLQVLIVFLCCMSVDYAAPLPTVRIIDPVGKWDYTIPKFEEVVFTLEISGDGTYTESVRYKKSGRKLPDKRRGKWKFSRGVLTFTDASSGLREYFRVHVKSDKDTIYTHWTSEGTQERPLRVDLVKVKFVKVKRTKTK